MKLEKKTLNDVPGIPCPFCAEGRIRFPSLESFLHAVQFGTPPRCDRCGGTVRMDSSGASRAIDRLRDVQRATDEAERLAASAHP